MQVALIRPIVTLASSHFTGVQHVLMIVSRVSTIAIDLQVAQKDVKNPSITTITVQERKDMNAFAVLTNVKHV